MICILLATCYSGLDRGDNTASLFVGTVLTYFLLISLSAFTISVLSTSVGFFNAFSVLSYCVSIYIPISIISPFLFFIFNIALAGGAFYFAMKAVLRILSPKIPQEKKYISLFPAAMTFLVFSWSIVPR